MWYRIVTTLAVVVVFATTYMLILPAITMENSAQCGIVEHQHDANCYSTHQENVKTLACTTETLNVHKHTDSCYDENHRLICGYADFVIHQHDANCYDENGVLVCTLPEHSLHQHTEQCYQAQTQLVCTQEESAGHTHDASCYTKEQSLACTQAEHTHGEDCYDAEGNLICEQEEHVHGDECYVWNDVLICDIPESEGHTHSESCYETVQVLICEEPYELHTHTDECYQDGVLACGKTELKEHQHGEDCYTQEQVLVETLICDQQEHVHTDECYAKTVAEEEITEEETTEEVTTESLVIEGTEEKSTEEESTEEETTEAETTTEEVAAEEETTEEVTTEEEETTEAESTEEAGTDVNDLSGDFVKEYSDDSISVRAAYTADAKIPEDAQLIVEQITEESSPEHYAKRLSEAGSAVGEAYRGKAGVLLKIGFYVDGVEIEPEAAVTLTISFSKNGIAEGSSVTVVHFTDNGTETITGTNVQKSKTSFEMPSFSEVMLLVDRTDLRPCISEDTKFNSAVYNPETDQVEASFYIDFKMNRDDIQAAAYLYKYTLPAGITIPDSMLNKKYSGYDSNGSKGFEYQFVKNGDGSYGILIDFDTSYVDKQDNFSGYISFNSIIGEEAREEGGEYQFQFSDTVEVIIPPSQIEQEDDESISYNISVNKSNSSYDYSNNKITYTVTVDTSKGTPDPLNLTDILDLNGLTVDHVQVGSVMRTDKNEWGGSLLDTVLQQFTLESDNATDQYSFSYDNDTKQIVMRLPGLQKTDGNYGQKYTIEYDVYLKEPAAGTYQVGNTAAVTGTDNSKGETVTDSAGSTVTIDKTLDVDKTGSYDKATETIKWKIVVNQNCNNIAGTKLTDSMFSQIQTGSVKVTPQNGYSIVTENGTLKEISFTELEGGVNKQTYTITYETDAPAVGKDDAVSISNTATVTLPDNTIKEDTATVSIDKNMKMTKTGSYDKTSDLITWTIIVNENENDIAGAELTDTMFHSIEASDITVTPGSGYQVHSTEEGFIDKITFEALEGGSTNTQSYTITYRTASGIGTGQSDTVTNTATFDPTPGENTGDEVSSEPEVYVDRTVDLEKEDSWYNNDQISWKIHINRNGDDITGYQLEDDLFTKYVNGTLKINNSTDYSNISGIQVKWDSENKYIESIEFTKTADGKANTAYYCIEYATSGHKGWDDGKVINTAKLTPPGGTTREDTGEAWVPGEGNVSKSRIAVTTPDADGNIVITWKASITVPQDGLPENTVVEDTLEGDNHWMSWNQVAALSAKLSQTFGSTAYTLTVFEKDASEGVQYSVDATGQENKKFVKFKLVFPNGLPAHTENNKTAEFEYGTSANVNNITNDVTFKNKISVTPPGGSTKSGEDSYTYFVPGVWKTDGNGQSGTSYISTTDGVLTWKVRVRLGTDCTTLTVTDTLPEGITLTGLSFAGTALTISDSSITGSVDGLNLSGAISGREVKLTAVLPENSTRPTYFKTQGEFYIVYTCQISDELMNRAQSSDDHKVGTFTNTVTAKEGDNTFPSSSQTQDVTYNKPTSGAKVIDKNGGWNNDARMLEYSIVLNPDGEDLLTNGDTLTLTDELSFYLGNSSVLFNAALLPGSVKLYRAVLSSDNTWQKGEAVTNWTWSVSTREENSNFYSTITAVIPDNTPLLMEYNYTVWVPEDSSFDNGLDTYYGLYNKATLTGISNGQDDNRFDVKWKESQTSAGITADRSYIFYKVEKDNYGNLLEGAMFTLFDENGNDLGKTYITNSAGSFSIKRQSDPVQEGEYEFQYNKLYYVQETAAPSGYMLPDNPQKYYFYFSSNEDTTNKLPDSLPEGAVDISKATSIVYCENEKNTTSITVTKKWFDTAGNDVTGSKTGSISFDLYRVESTTPPAGENSGEGSESGINYKILSHTYNEVESGIREDLQIGSKVQIKVTMKYLGWHPEVYLSGLNYDNITWDNDKNVGTVEATVTEPNIVIDVKDNRGNFTVSIEKLSDPQSSGEGGTSTAPTGIKQYTFTITHVGGWSWRSTDLPKTGKDSEGNTIYYSYYVQEKPVANYTTEYENNSGIASGTITIKNTANENPSYELPETGGTGTIWYTLGGLLLSMAAVYLLYKKSNKSAYIRNK